MAGGYPRAARRNGAGAVMPRSPEARLSSFGL